MRSKLKLWMQQLVWPMIMLRLIKLLLWTSQFLGIHFPLSRVQIPIPVIHLAIPVIHLLQNPNLLVQTKVKIPHLRLFAIIVSNRVMWFPSAWLWRERVKNKRDVSPWAWPLYDQNQSCVKDQIPIQAKTSVTGSEMEIYEPFLSDGFVSINSDYAQSTPIKILRDTGASQSLILADTWPFSKKTFSWASALVQGVECGFVNVPVHNIYLSSDLITGPVAVGIRPPLPFIGVHLLLSNDLAGDKVMVNPLLTVLVNYLIQMSRKFLIFNLLVPSLW